MELFSQPTKLALGFGVLNAFQTEVKSLLGSVNGGGSGLGLIALVARPFPPSCLNGSPRTLTALFGSELRGSGGTALLAAFTTQGDRRWVLPL